LIMRVALLTNFIPPYRVSLFRALRKEVGELRVFISTPMERNRGWTPDWADLDVVVQRSVSMRRTWRTRDFAEDYELHIPYDTIAQLRKWRPDAIITGELGARSLQAVMYAQLAKVPVVLWATLSDLTEQNRGALRETTRKWLIPRFDAVIVNGEAGARYIRRYRGDEPTRVPYTTDMSSFRQLPLERLASRMLFVGSMTERKGVTLLLDAASLWARSNPGRTLDLTLIGEGPLKRTLQARNLPANLRVTWAGHVSYEELPHWFEGARTLIFPSLADEWGMVVNEALAAGVPVIGSRNSQAVEELIEDGVNGWTFQPDSAEKVSGVIDRALSIDEATHMRMRAAARAAAGALEPDVAAARMAGLLRNL
jgi:glycosyltransferase involved in cell wall biosynthesis